MKFLDDIKKAVGSRLGGVGQAELIQPVVGLINSAGGVSGLAETFRSRGFGKVMSSWISTGKNLPITAEQIKKALGSSKVAEIAEKAGVSVKDAAGSLAKILPGVIDRLTPDGTVPEGTQLKQRLSALKK